MIILNGMCDGDKEGKFTYIAPNGSSVDDYFIVSAEFPIHRSHLVVADQTHSGHLPVELSVDGKTHMNNSSGDVIEREVEKIVWNDDYKDSFVEATLSDEACNLLQDAKEKIHVNLDSALEIFTSYLNFVSDCMKKKIRVGNYKQTDPSWFDKDCLKKKRETLSALRKFRRTLSAEDRRAYCTTRKQYKSLQKCKKEAFRQEKLSQLQASCGNGNKFWDTVRSITRKPLTRHNITLDEWKNHFQLLLNRNMQHKILLNMNLQNTVK